MTPSTIRDRLPYQPIVTRPKLRLPGDARVAVWTIVNVENWSPSDPMPRAVLPPPMGQPLLPDVPNWAWHEYGMRVGFWRFLEALDARGLKATFAVNGTACALYEEACRAALRRAGISWDTATSSGRCTRSKISAPRSTTRSRRSRPIHRQAAARMGKPRALQKPPKP